MICNLLTLLKRIEIDLSWRLDPFEEIMWGILVFLLHEHISWTSFAVLILLRYFIKEVFYKFIVVSFAKHYLSTLWFAIIFC